MSARKKSIWNCSLIFSSSMQTVNFWLVLETYSLGLTVEYIKFVSPTKVSLREAIWNRTIFARQTAVSGGGKRIFFSLLLLFYSILWILKTRK